MQKHKKSNKSFFESLKDADFYSDKLTHIYFYSDVSKESIRDLKAEILKACEPVTENGVVKNPKPILLHINSPGGSAYAGMSSLSLFTECKVPIAVMVDGLSASAATFISIYAPYRVATPYSTCLIHECSGMIIGKESDIKHEMHVIKQMDKFLNKMYLKHMRITKEELKELNHHDYLLDSDTCLKHGIFDRIIVPENGRDLSLKRYNAQNPDLDLPILVLLKKNNINHINIECMGNDPYTGVKALLQKIDAMVLQDSANVRPVIFYTSYYQCTESLYAEYLPLISKISALHVPSIGIIDSIVRLHDILPVLCCTRRVMYECGQVVIHVMYKQSKAWVFADAVHNTMLILNKIKDFLSERTKMPKDMIDNLEKKRWLLSPQQCLEYGIVHEIIPML